MNAERQHVHVGLLEEFYHLQQCADFVFEEYGDLSDAGAVEFFDRF